METYTVKIDVPIWATGTIEVKAKNIAEAEAKALEVAEEKLTESEDWQIEDDCTWRQMKVIEVAKAQPK